MTEDVSNAAGGSGSDEGPADGHGVASRRSPVLAELCDRYWRAELEMHPTAATLLGVHDHDDRLEDLSEDTDSEHRNVLRALLAQLDGSDGTGFTDGTDGTGFTGFTDGTAPLGTAPLGTAQLGTAQLGATQLNAADRVTAALLRHQLRVGITSIDLRLVELASDQMLGPHAELLMIAPQLTYPEPDHAEAALVRYSQVPRLLGQALDRFRAGLGAGRTPAAAVLARSLHTLDAYLSGPLEADPFLAAQLPAQWTHDDRSSAEQWRTEMGELVRDRIRPAFQMYRNVLRDELGPRARDDDHAGWCWLPDGEELYAALVARHTTVNQPPGQLHELGRRLCEVDLPVEFATVGADAIGTEDLSAIFDRLRSDPQLRHRDAQEVVETARRSVERATAAMPGWFGRLPTAACSVEPIPDFLAADAPYAYYFPPAPDGTRPGTYFINTADPTGSSRTEAESIAFHEAIPGHHLQISISQELEDLPSFQRHDGATSYIEGWGLYSERLADEMGLYSSPLDRLGMLTADAWRSARLVVDTGMHAMGWSRQQALDYFAEHTPVPSDQIASEVDRYLAMPAQALSYKVGQLEIQRLRAVATERLGDRFDIAEFHDVVLGSGAVTLPVLADLVADWLDGSVSPLG